MVEAAVAPLSGICCRWGVMLGLRCWSLVRDTTSGDWDLIPLHSNLLSSLCVGPLGFSSLPLWVSRSFFYVVTQLHVPERKLGSCQRDVEWESLDPSSPAQRTECILVIPVTGNKASAPVAWWSLLLHPSLHSGFFVSVTKIILLILLLCV